MNFGLICASYRSLIIGGCCCMGSLGLLLEAAHGFSWPSYASRSWSSPLGCLLLVMGSLLIWACGLIAWRHLLCGFSWLFQGRDRPWVLLAFLVVTARWFAASTWVLLNFIHEVSSCPPCKSASYVYVDVSPRGGTLWLMVRPQSSGLQFVGGVQIVGLL